MYKIVQSSSLVYKIVRVSNSQTCLASDILFGIIFHGGVLLTWSYFMSYELLIFRNDVTEHWGKGIKSKLIKKGIVAVGQSP